MVSTSLAFRILAQDEGANKVLSQVGVSAGKAEGRLSLLARASGTFGSATRDAFRVAGAALVGAGLVEGLKSIWQEAQASNLVTKQTEAVIKSTGKAAHVTADQVGDLASAIGDKTAVDDEAVQSGANLLLTFTGIRNEVGKGNNVFDQATAAVVDMTAAMNGGVVTQENMKSASIQVGKALNDPVKGIAALTKVGVTFTAAQKEQITALVAAGDTMSAQKIILKELNREFGGSAEAAATGAKRLGVVIGNVKETLGKGLVTVVDNLSNRLSDALPTALEKGQRALGLIEDPIRRIWHDLSEWAQGMAQWGSAVVKPLAVLAGATIVGGLHALAAVLDFLDRNRDVFVPLAAGALTFLAASKGIGFVVSIYQAINGVIETMALKALYAKDALIGLATGETAAKVAGTGLGAAMGPIGVAVAAVSIAVGFLALRHMNGKQAAEEHRNAVDNFSQTLRDNKNAINDNVIAQRAQELEQKGLLSLAQQAGVSLSDYTAATLGNADAQRVVGRALRDAAGSGKLTFDQYTELANGTADYVSITEDSVAANGRLAEVTTSVGSATDTTTAATKQAAVAAQAAKKADDDLWTSLNKLANINLQAASAHLAVQSAILQVDGSLHGLDATTARQTRTLAINTVAGVAARQQLISNVQAILADGEAQKARGKSTEQATAVMRTDLGALRTHYLQLGYSKQAVDGIIGSLVNFGKQHPVATTKVTTAQATGAIKTVTRQLDLLNGRVVRIFINGEVSGIGTSVPNVGPRTATHAGGGMWSGWSWTGEQGPELSYTQPKDRTATYTAQQSREMVSALRSGQGGSAGVHIDNVNITVQGATGRDAALQIAKELNGLKRSGFTVDIG